MIRRLLIAILGGAAALGGVDVGEQERDLRRRIQQVERAIDRRFADLRDETPMMTLGTTRGAYLNGYGVVFTLQVNLAPVAAVSPFRQAYSEEERSELNARKRARLEVLERKACEILIEESAGLPAMPGRERVAVAISLFHFAWEDLAGLPSQVIYAAPKRALDEARGEPLAAKDQLRRLEVTYF